MDKRGLLMAFGSILIAQIFNIASLAEIPLDYFTVESIKWSSNTNETNLEILACSDNLPLSAKFYLSCFQIYVPVVQDNSTQASVATCANIRAEMKTVIKDVQVEFPCSLRVQFFNGSYIEKIVMIPVPPPKNTGNTLKSSTIFHWIIIAPVGLLVLVVLLVLCCGTLQKPDQGSEPTEPSNMDNNTPPIHLLPVVTSETDKL